MVPGVREPSVNVAGGSFLLHDRSAQRLGVVYTQVMDTNTTSAKGTTTMIRNASLLRSIFDAIYHDFALDTNDIAARFFAGDLDSSAAAYRACKKLESLGVVTGEIQDAGSGRGRATSQQRPGQSVLWQCWNTYDSTDEAAHAAEAVAKGLLTDSEQAEAKALVADIKAAAKAQDKADKDLLARARKLNAAPAAPKAPTAGGPRPGMATVPGKRGSFYETTANACPACGRAIDQPCAGKNGSPRVWVHTSRPGAPKASRPAAAVAAPALSAKDEALRAALVQLAAADEAGFASTIASAMAAVAAIDPDVAKAARSAIARREAEAIENSPALADARAKLAANVMLDAVAVVARRADELTGTRDGILGEFVSVPEAEADVARRAADAARKRASRAAAKAAASA